MILGIDATNIRSGGGITHLREILRAGNPPDHGFTEVILWSSRKTLGAVEDRPWLRKLAHEAIEGSLIRRSLWQRFMFPREARKQGVDVLFVPGGGATAGFRPVVTMSRNLLPFMRREIARYGFSSFALKMNLLRWAQIRDFRRADGVVFLTRFAASEVAAVTGPMSGRKVIIPHGVDARFLHEPREPRSIENCTEDSPMRILYVSIIDLYKHQWHVIEAVAHLRAKGWPLVLDLVGPIRPCAAMALERAMNAFDPDRKFVVLHGDVPHLKIHECYHQADLFLFASSCENMPNILLEGMASGLPIACSSRGPMPEVLLEGGSYFDPEDPSSISRALKELISSPALRSEAEKVSVALAKTHTWSRCAEETFEFLATFGRQAWLISADEN